jgi:polar amino acid transport system permease protein
VGPRAGQPPTVVPLRHYGRWLSAIVVAALTALLVNALATNEQFDYGAIRTYLFSDVVLKGVWNTLLLTLLAQAIGVALGIVLAVMRGSPNPVLRVTSWVYIWLFRGTPVLVQLIFWFNLGLIFKNVTIGIPGTDLNLIDEPTNSVVTPFAAALLGLALNEAAYMAEIVRGGLLGVDRGQVEAASALGMTRGLALRRILLPQAVRIIIPPTGNETINMLKTTSIASVIAYNDLLNQAKSIYNETLETLELLVVASIWYLAMTSVLSVGQFFLERYYGRSEAEHRDSFCGVMRRALRLRRPAAEAVA